MNYRYLWNFASLSGEEFSKGSASGTVGTTATALWLVGFQRLLQNCRAFDVACMLGEDKSREFDLRG